MLRGKVWVLVAHAVVVTAGQANFFKTSLHNKTQSYAAVVMLAGQNTTSVDVRLRCDKGSEIDGCGDIPRSRLIASVLHPGQGPSPLSVDWGGGGELMFSKLPLLRGCAMIVLRDSKDPWPPPAPLPLPPSPSPPTPAPAPPGSCTAGCKLVLAPCTPASPSQHFTYDGRHLHHTASGACVDMNKKTLAVGLWSPCETAAEDDQWWAFAKQNGSSGALSGLLRMEGVAVHGKAPCLDASSPTSLTATTACDAKALSQHWALASAKGALLRNAAAGLCAAYP
eukprot:COSAG01_NODE_1939_length_8846_cov_15.705385_3_plen_281_part_00